MLQYNAYLQLLHFNGTMSQRPFTSNASVITFNYATPVAVPTPSPADPVQLDPAARIAGVRFVRVNAAAGACLHFREIMVRSDSGRM